MWKEKKRKEKKRKEKKRKDGEKKGVVRTKARKGKKIPRKKKTCLITG